MGFPYFPMVFLWFSHGFPMVYGFPMVFLWFSNGFPMGFPWFSYVPGQARERPRGDAGSGCSPRAGSPLLPSTQGGDGGWGMGMGRLMMNDDYIMMIS